MHFERSPSGQDRKREKKLSHTHESTYSNIFTANIINSTFCCCCNTNTHTHTHSPAVVRPYRLQDAAAVAAHNFLEESGDADADPDLDDDFGGRQHQTPLRTPDFVTLGQKYSVAIGSTIVLPCRINDSG